MPVLRIKRVHMRNWMTVREATVDLPESGVVHVLGRNMTNDGKFESIGAGKTALGEALNIAVSGAKGRYTYLRDYSTNGKGNLYVAADGTLDEVPIKIEFGYKCKELSEEGEGLRFTHGERVIQRGHIKDTRVEISNALGLQDGLSKWTVYIDGDNLKFSGLSQRDAVDLLMCSLNQPPWTQYHERAKKTLNKFTADLENAESAQREAESSHTEAKEDLESAEEELTEVRKKHRGYEETKAEKVRKLEEERQRLQSRVSKLEERQKEIKKLIDKETVRGAEAYKELELARKRAVSMTARAARFKERLTEKRATSRERLQTAKDRLEELESQPKDCPRCGKPLDKQVSRQEIREAEDQVEIRRERVQRLKELYERACRDEEKYGRQQEEYDQKIHHLRSEDRIQKMSDEHEENSEEIRHLGRDVADIDRRARECEANPYEADKRAGEAVVKERTKNVERAKERAEKAARELVEIRESIRVVSYWTDAFSPTGIPNMILKEAIAPLNSISKRLSTIITGGILNINYSTSRELASGKERSELVIRPENAAGAAKVEGSSKGEGGLTNLIIAETIAEVGMVAKRIGFRWYDEVVNSQDPVVRRNIFSYLKGIASGYGILVFVVDHHAETSNYADHLLMAEKTRDGTTYRWLK